MTKRVCFIRQSFVYPGGEASVRREVETLACAGFETHIICLNSQKEEKLSAQEVIDGIHVYRIPVVRKKTNVIRYAYEYLMFFFRAALKVTQLHLKHPFDAIQVNTMPDFLVFASLIPKLLKSKVVLMMHEPVPELWQTLYDSRPPWILKKVEQAALAYADGVLTVTQQLKDAYVSRGADPNKISVILNVPEERFLTSGKPFGNASSNNGHFTLICHGAVEKRYGHDTMLKAIELVKSQIPAVRLRILGNGGYAEAFAREIEHRGLKEHIQYLGYVPIPVMLEELHAADAGIVAQESSPYSNLVHTNKMYEYMALGKPVLATRLKSVCAYFGDDAIAYFEPGNPESLAAAISNLYHHPEERQLRVEKARGLYDQYRWEKQKEIYLSVYHQLLNTADGS
jgi:glycosyltransferase involved in cell wall biosynthesis